jgi:hypothetical protein
MTTGSTSTSNSSTSNTFAQYNPAQFGLQGQANNGYYAGLGSIPLGGFGATNSGTDGSFDSLFSSLNSSGTFGPGLNSNLGPAGANSQAISLASEGASAASFALLNKLAPTDLPPEALYSSSVFGTQGSGLSIFDTLSTVASGIAGTLPLKGKGQELVLALGPAIGALGGLFGLFRGLGAAFKTPTVRAHSSKEALQDYEAEQMNSQET